MRLCAIIFPLSVTLTMNCRSRSILITLLTTAGKTREAKRERDNIKDVEQIGDIPSWFGHGELKPRVKSTTLPEAGSMYQSLLRSAFLRSFLPLTTVIPSLWCTGLSLSPSDEGTPGAFAPPMRIR